MSSPLTIPDNPFGSSGSNFWTGFASSLVSSAQSAVQMYFVQRDRKEAYDMQLAMSFLDRKDSPDAQAAGAAVLAGIGQGKIKPGQAMSQINNLMNKTGKAPGWLQQNYDTAMGLVADLTSKGVDVEKVFGVAKPQEPLPPGIGSRPKSQFDAFMPNRVTLGQLDQTSQQSQAPNPFGASSTPNSFMGTPPGGAGPPPLPQASGVPGLVGSGQPTAATPPMAQPEVREGPGSTLNRDMMMSPAGTSGPPPGPVAATPTPQPQPASIPTPDQLTENRLEAMNLTSEQLGARIDKAQSEADAVLQQLAQCKAGTVPWNMTGACEQRRRELGRHYELLKAEINALTGSQQALTLKQGEILDQATKDSYTLGAAPRGEAREGKRLKIYEANLGLRKMELMQRERLSMVRQQLAAAGAEEKKQDRILEDLRKGWSKHTSDLSTLYKGEKGDAISRAISGTPTGQPTQAKTLSPGDVKVANLSYANYLQSGFYNYTRPSFNLGKQVWKQLGVEERHLENAEPSSLIGALRSSFSRMAAAEGNQNPTAQLKLLRGYQSAIIALSRLNTKGYYGTLGELTDLNQALGY